MKTAALPQRVTYKGAEYQLAESPPQVVQYQGQSYRLAVDGPPPYRFRAKPAQIVWKLNFLANIRTFIDELFAVMGPVNKLLSGTTKNTSNLRKITDAGWNPALLAKLDADGSLALLDATADDIAKLHGSLQMLGDVAASLKETLLAEPDFDGVTNDHTFQQTSDAEYAHLVEPLIRLRASLKRAQTVADSRRPSESE